MSIPKITEIIVEPIKIYTNTKFNIKVKIESEYLLQQKIVTEDSIEIITEDNENIVTEWGDNNE